MRAPKSRVTVSFDLPNTSSMPVVCTCVCVGGGEWGDYLTNTIIIIIEVHWKEAICQKPGTRTIVKKSEDGCVCQEVHYKPVKQVSVPTLMEASTAVMGQGVMV